jgi:hypothetical protein
MLELDNWGLLTVITGGIGTLAIFSFLFKENSFYRFFEHVFIGIAAGYAPIYTIRDNLWPKILEPMLGLNIIHFPDGTASAPYEPWRLLYIAPLLFGLLYYFIYSRRHSWLAKIVIGFSLGSTAGLTYQGFFASVIPQLTASFKPLLVYTPEGVDIWDSFNNLFFVYTLIAVMLYFLFSYRMENKAVRGITYSGRWLMMICFGAYFGSTVMARLALLVERLQFLIVDFSSALSKIFH